jgi:arylsulfatase A-like enzyme
VRQPERHSTSRAPRRGPLGRWRPLALVAGVASLTLGALGCGSAAGPAPTLSATAMPTATGTPAAASSATVTATAATTETRPGGSRSDESDGDATASAPPAWTPPPGRRREHPEPKIAGVRLVVLVVVDQLAFDTLERARPALRGGFARLLAESVELRQAWHRHGIATTSPGHATLVTGLEPRRHGMVHNDWFDRTRDEQVWAHEDPESGETGPVNLRASGLGDWIRDRDPQSLSYSVGVKHRAVVLLGGLRPNGAFWFEPDDEGFTSSALYPPAPDWLDDAFVRDPLRAHFGTSWEMAPLPPGIDPRALGFVQLAGSAIPRPFPHQLGDATTRPDTMYFAMVEESPFADVHAAALARELVARQGLGADDHLDYLGVALSSLDDVGHVYGQHSLEALDTVLRVDRALGELLDFLEERVGRDRLLVVLSADHGATPMPEAMAALGESSAGRKTAGSIACVQQVDRRLDEAFGPRDWFRWHLYLDEAVVAASGVSRADVDRVARGWLEGCPGIQRVWTRADLLPEPPAEGTATETFLAEYRHGFDAERSPDYLLMFEERFADRTVGTNHRTPWEHDAHVPLLLRVPGVAPRRLDDAVATRDLAPTLAALLGLSPETAPDGRDLSPLMLAP